MLKSDLLKTDTLDFNCGYEKVIRDLYASKTRRNQYNFHFDYHKIKDTLINNNPSVKYAVVNKRKFRKNRNLKLNDFIVIEKNSNLIAPNFTSFFELEQWNKSGIHSNGIISYQFHKFKHHDEIQLWEQKLVRYSKFDKVLKINLSCQ
ncbi:hypothetical protein N7U66_06040 [Lacinutrix neustonica]|uniref:Uncharacterized protein n=1 Tax=Lacinutrix neustonica TaxID=2980107 RepID=A0A9E8MZ41_9FLAO|nr:hypothetical protein [Lacinutrix neustonica]WAC03162.1 hypothetical protein N7U66_06040 [Lacinutrix neustonica]